MANGIEELVEMLHDMVSDAWAVPFGTEKCVLERDKALDLIDEIRENLPTELKEARTVVESRNEILASAKREAEAIKRTAEERARQLISEEEILTIARKKANDIVSAAENRSREVRRAASAYADDMLKRLEDVSVEALGEIRKNRQDFKNITRSQNQ